MGGRGEGGTPIFFFFFYTACTCYTVGGMPLAFTQEDFLVVFAIRLMFCCLDITVVIPDNLGSRPASAATRTPSRPTSAGKKSPSPAGSRRGSGGSDRPLSASRERNPSGQSGAATPTPGRSRPSSTHSGGASPKPGGSRKGSACSNVESSQPESTSRPVSAKSGTAGAKSPSIKGSRPPSAKGSRPASAKIDTGF